MPGAIFACYLSQAARHLVVCATFTIRTASWGLFKVIFLWSQKGLGGHSTLRVKTDIWVKAVGYQQLVGAATLGGGLTSHTGGRRGLLVGSEGSWRTFYSWGQDRQLGRSCWLPAVGGGSLSWWRAADKLHRFGGESKWQLRLRK